MINFPFPPTQLQFQFVGELKPKEPYPQGYSRYFNQSSQCDFDMQFICSDKIIPAHKPIIYATAPVLFCKMIQEKAIKGPRGLVYVHLEETNYEVMSNFIHFLYTGRVRSLGTNYYHFWALAEKYHCALLKAKCINYISISMGPENVLQAFQLAFHYKNKTLKDNCIGLIKM